MSEDLAKQTIRKAIKKIFTYEFEELMSPNDYLELLEICQHIENLSAHYSLIFKAIESLFIDKGKFKEKIENNDAIKYLDYLIDKKSFSPDFKDEFLKYIEHEKYKKIFKALNASEKEKLILEYICQIKKDIEIIIDCINIIYSDKLPNYVPSQENFPFKGTFIDFLDQLENFLNYNDFEKEKECISLEYNTEYGFYFKEYSYEEAIEIMEKVKMNKKKRDVKKFIVSHSKISQKSEEYLNLNLQVNDDKSSKNQDIIKRQVDNKKENEKENNDELNHIKEELEEFKKKYSKLEKSHSDVKKELSDLKNIYNKDKKELDEYKQKNKINEYNMKKSQKIHEYKINQLNNIITDQKKKIETIVDNERKKYSTLIENYDKSKVANNELIKEKEEQKNTISTLNKEKETLNRKLETIRCRALSKSIIDFLYYAFTSLFKGKTYLEEKNSIINQITILKNNEYKSQKIILSEFANYIEKIYSLKLEGDDYAHPLIGINDLINLIGYGFENVNKLLKELDLSELFKKYNELYRKKSMEEDLKKITEEIQKLLPELRDTFFLKLRNAK